MTIKLKQQPNKISKLTSQTPRQKWMGVQDQGGRKFSDLRLIKEACGYESTMRVFFLVQSVYMYNSESYSQNPRETEAFTNPASVQ